MPTDAATSRVSAARLVAVVCGAQVMVQIGAYFWPALLPEMMRRWSLSNSEAGWITAIFYAAYMVSVPVLVTLTDRIDAKRVYLFGVGCSVLGHLLFGLLAEGFWSAMALRALTGLGWAGTYMTGLKLLADQVDARMMSRAVTGHAASIGISGALSFLCGDLLAEHAGWRAAFVLAGASAAIAWLTVALVVPARQPPARPAGQQPALFDFRPVLRNRSAMAYALAYCVHTLEMNALRGWGVAFLAFVAARTGAAEGAFSPTLVRHRARPDRHDRERGRQRGRHPPRPPPSRLHRHGPLDCASPRSWASSARSPTPSPWRSSCCTARWSGSIPRRSRRVRRAPRNRRGAARRSPFIPCWAMPAASSARSPSAGRSISRAACRPPRGDWPSLSSRC